MAFGQQSGPPASAKQVRDLLALVQGAGHRDFRDARGPLGLSQRQAGGRFTRDEADELIERLRDAEDNGTAPAATGAPERLSAAELTVRAMPAALLGAELQRRGWLVIEP